MSFSQVALSTVAEVNPRFDHPANRDLDERVSFVPMANVSATRGAITKEEERSLANVLKGFTPFVDRDVLLAKITPCFENGKIAHARITKRFGFGSTEFHVIRAQTATLDDRYIYQYLRTPSVRAEGVRRMTGSAGQKRVPKAFLDALLVPLPSLQEQRRIAAVLDKADALRVQRRVAIAKLDELLQSVFIEMFGDPLTNSKGWIIQRLGDACEKVTVGIVVKPADWYVESGIPAIRSLNIGVNRIIQKNFVYFNETDNTGPLKKTMLRAGDVVVVRSGQPGKAAVIPPSLDGANAIDVLIARTNKEKMLPLFLSYFVNSQAGKQLVLAEQRGQVQKHLNVKQLSEAEIPLPPLDLQNRFAQIAEKIETQKQTMQRAAEKAETLFASLQHHAFSGKL